MGEGVAALNNDLLCTPPLVETGDSFKENLRTRRTMDGVLMVLITRCVEVSGLDQVLASALRVSDGNWTPMCLNLLVGVAGSLTARSHSFDEEEGVSSLGVVLRPRDGNGIVDAIIAFLSTSSFSERRLVVTVLGIKRFLVRSKVWIWIG